MANLTQPSVEMTVTVKKLERPHRNAAVFSAVATEVAAKMVVGVGVAVVMVVVAVVVVAAVVVAGVAVVVVEPP
jgi:hypothetical protein